MPLSAPISSVIENIYLKFVGEDRPYDAQPQTQANLIMINTRNNQIDALNLLVDHREDHPSSLELQGYTTYHGRRYRATVVCNRCNTLLDGAMLVYHI